MKTSLNVFTVSLLKELYCPQKLTLLEQYHKYENELECFYSFIAEGIILPSKANWYDIAKRHPNIFFKSCKTN